MIEQQRPVDLPQDAPSIADLFHLLGLQRVNLHDCITVQREGGDASAFSPKEQIAAMEALIIDEIWVEVSRWIKDHAEVYGLAETNVPELTTLSRPAFEAAVPLSPHIKPIAQNRFEDLRQVIVSCNDRSIACTMIEPFARNVLQYHLVQWEAEQKLHAEFGWVEEPKSDYYERYIALLKKYQFSVATSRFPATRKMVHGFTFGQHVLWHLPMHTSDEVIDKIAMTHLHVLRHINPTAFTPQELFAFDASGTAQAFNPARLSAARADVLRTGPHREEFAINPSESRVTTGCPAFFTEAFQGIREWIAMIKREMIDPA
ncbi:MAG: hypothetical protein Greene041662_880 [Candidatus Peregrinibacteria bacterium Greene0416_62]|nr:MAG: hypothetical protein Greene041662_880 [Candidatus Peregrinibacteria bacterium Greene0416_62]TSC97591.1 MAG: hypothetical protein Greene101449_1158 [Candidatus Peregrinibacteria bacterium Greene1014_49]